MSGRNVNFTVRTRAKCLCVGMNRLVLPTRQTGLKRHVTVLSAPDGEIKGQDGGSLLSTSGSADG